MSELCDAPHRPWLFPDGDCPYRCTLLPAGHLPDPYMRGGYHSDGNCSWDGTLSLPVPCDGVMGRQPAEWVIGKPCHLPCCLTAPDHDHPEPEAGRDGGVERA